MKWKIYKSAYFKKLKEKLFKKSKDDEFENLYNKLKRNGDKTGRYLQRTDFREEKSKGYRIYYCTIDDIGFIALLDISTKKLQQETIDYYTRELDTIKQMIRIRIKEL